LTAIAIAGAYWLTVRAKKKVSVFGAFCRIAPFGAVYCVAMFWWVLHSIYVVPELTAQFAIWTVPGVLGLAIAGAIIFSIPFVVLRKINMSGAGHPFMFAAVWVLVLWLREWMFTGFPWNPIANIMLPLPLFANSMALWGALGLSFVIVGFVAAVVEMLRIRTISRVLTFAVFSVLVFVGCVAGRVNMRVADMGAENAQHLIRVVQPAIDQAQKATHDRATAMRNADFNLRRMVALASSTAQPDLIVFPETAYPFVIVEGDMMPLAAALGTNVVIGATTYIDNAVQNSMIVADKNGQITSVYSKSHLVPFGEYRPLGFLPSPVNLKAGDGAELISLNVDNGGFVFAPAICYEIIFSDSLVPMGASDMPTAVINITNDNWFGNTPGTYQHLDMVRRYAIESGLPIVRANYSGISAFVLSDGSVLSALPVGTAGSLDGFVWGAHMTPYRMIGMNWWLIIILGFACIGVFGTRTSKRDN
ncbi:MAG: apolipoprotein N-acyltransferase, partial [Alphaproteobacteria bacterium]|nr:apolipoprotein N-acyltransferase [Alphaproteobacteria bacterium]